MSRPVSDSRLQHQETTQSLQLFAALVACQNHRSKCRGSSSVLAHLLAAVSKPSTAPLK